MNIIRTFATQIGITRAVFLCGGFVAAFYAVSVVTPLSAIAKSRHQSTHLLEDHKTRYYL